MTANLCAVLVPAVALIAAAGGALAQEYPAKSVRVVVPFAPGGNADGVARVVMPKLAARLGNGFGVENRSGGGGTIGTEIVARAPADGYTLCVITGSHAMNASLHGRLPFNAMRDFEPISLLATGAGVLVVHPTLRIRSVRDLVAAAKASPGRLHYASAGPGTPPQLAAELFQMLARVRMVHVPRKGMAEGLADVAAGKAAVVSFPAISSALPLIQSKRVRALAVTGTRRAAILPDLPTIAEAGVRGFDATMWYGLVARAGTSSDIVGRLQEEIAQIVYAPDIRDRLTELGLDPAASTPEEFAALIRADIRKWARVVEAAKIKVD